ncbi:uncharacterized protein G2W53_012151 [Senna tora]|uniref:Uncharacterized protein n=1 Tax=Senna tora TaxID=362788 RepID=A0A834WQG8_9FABA|nr:uncharacterized protein G2W53_012151 [Senna tora]
MSEGSGDRRRDVKLKFMGVERMLWVLEFRVAGLQKKQQKARGTRHCNYDDPVFHSFHVDTHN